MKNQKQLLQFKTHTIIELNSRKLLSIKGGSNPVDAPTTYTDIKDTKPYTNESTTTICGDITK